MDCQKIREYMYPFIDGELDSQTELLVKEHLSICPLCGLELEQEKRMDSLIRQNVSNEEAPFGLKERLLNSIEETRINLKPALAIASAVILAAIFILPALLDKSNSRLLFTESISSHIKFLQGGLPVEVASNDPKEISKWLEGKLDFAVRVPDLSSKGVALIGARLHHLMEKKAAYLIYQIDGCNISAFVVDMSDRNIRKVGRITSGKNVFFVKDDRGYQSILCVDKSGIGCIFVSKLPEERLIELIS